MLQKNKTKTNLALKKKQTKNKKKRKKRRKKKWGPCNFLVPGAQMDHEIVRLFQLLLFYFFNL